MNSDDLMEFLSANRSWLLAPFLTMNATLSFLESVQRFCCFDREEVVGTVTEITIHPVRSTKPLRLSSVNLRITAAGRNKQIAIYETVPNLERMTGHISKPCESLNITSRMSGEEKLTLSYPGKNDLHIRYADCENGRRIWITEKDGREYREVGPEADKWFSEILGRPVKPLYCPRTNGLGEWNTTVYRSPDGAPVPTPPLHIISNSTVDKLSEVSGQIVEGERFRPNIMVEGSKPFDEELWHVLRIGDQVEVEQTFLNPRCGVVNALNGTYSPATLNSLFKHGYRDSRNRPCMGIYMKVLRPGIIREGDTITLLKRGNVKRVGAYKLSSDIIIGA